MSPQSLSNLIKCHVSVRILGAYTHDITVVCPISPVRMYVHENPFRFTICFGPLNLSNSVLRVHMIQEIGQHLGQLFSHKVYHVLFFRFFYRPSAVLISWASTQVLWVFGAHFVQGASLFSMFVFPYMAVVGFEPPTS